MVLVIQNFTIKLKMSELSTICRLFPFCVDATDETLILSFHFKKFYMSLGICTHIHIGSNIYGVCVFAVWFIPKYVDSFVGNAFFSSNSTKKNDGNKVLSFLKLSTQNGQEREKQYNVETNKKSSDVVQFWSKYVSRKGKKSEKRQKDRNIPSKCSSFTANHNCLILRFGMKLDLYRIMKSLSQFY